MKKTILLLTIGLVFFFFLQKNVAPIVIKKNITYKVNSTAERLSVNYYNEHGVMVASEIVGKTWQYDFKATPNTYLYLGAKNLTPTGSVNIEILVNDKVKFKNSTVLPYGAVNCSGFVD
ncbi:MAG: hypothetical protein IPH17_04000 [Bacteroidales bacterium]|nr:hypothetical protein [Bacteroidales bacterium]